MTTIPTLNPPPKKEIGFDVVRFDGIPGNYPIRLQQHPQKKLELIWVLDGTGKHVINQEVYTLCPRTIYAALPGQEHELCLNEGFAGYVITFQCTEERTEEVLLSQDTSLLQYCFSRNPMLLIEDDDCSEMLQVLSLLEKELANYSLFRKEFLSSYLQIFLLQIRRHLERSFIDFKPHGNGNLLIQDFFALVERNFKTQRAVSEYASELAVTPNHLNHVIKTNSGFCAGHHIRQRVILEAKKKMRHSNASLKQIAYQLGFEDSAHFSKFFKTYAGINFSDYKKQAQVLA